MSMELMMSCKRSAKYWLALAPLALACGAANALGLGQIQVKSQPGEPFVAQIPILISSPDEMVGLRAGLADPATFERVGLATPSGSVSDLRFKIVTNERGLPAIEVFTPTPVQEPLLNFLVELNWGQGKMVREFSALVNTPGSMSSPLPAIEHPQAAPSNLISRESTPIEGMPDMGERHDIPQEWEMPYLVGPGFSEEGGDQGEPDVQATPPHPAISSSPQEQSVDIPYPVKPDLRAGEVMGTVARGQVLSQIAKPLVEQEGRTLNEAMMALFKANPQAFIRGNINLIKEGAILRAPSEEHWSSEEVANSGNLVAQHVAQWREWNEPVKVSTPSPEGDTSEELSASTHPKESSTPDARLEIVPNKGEDSSRGIASGQSTEGDGELLMDEQGSIELEEEISRQLELEDLKSRIEDLEALMASQQKLIEMKENQLAQAQEALRQHQQKQKEGTVEISTRTLWGLGGLLVLISAVWGWAMRRRDRRQRERTAFLREGKHDA